jgi:hypothetical protein
MRDGRDRFIDHLDALTASIAAANVRSTTVVTGSPTYRIASRARTGCGAMKNPEP